MLYCGLLTAMALGLPFGLAVFPVHAARYMRAAAAARRGGPEAQPELVAPFQDEVDEPLLLVRSAPKLCACLHGLPVLWAGWWGLLVCIGMTAVQHQRAVQVRVLPSTAHSAGMIAARSALRLLSLLSRFHGTLMQDRGTLRLRGSGAALPVQGGRPDFEGLLREVNEECPPACGTIGVYVGGPKGLNTAVQLAVSNLNARRGAASTYFELHRETVEL